MARFGLHSLAGFDDQMTQVLKVGYDKTVAMNSLPPEFRRFWFSPEFRAGYVLAMFGVVSGILLVMSTVGGAVGGFMRMRRNISA